MCRLFLYFIFCFLIVFFFFFLFCVFFCFQAEDGIRDLVRSRGLGDVYKRQVEVGFDAGQRPDQSLVADREAHAPASHRVRLRHRGELDGDVHGLSLIHI